MTWLRALRGRAWVFGDDVNTDVIHPPQFYSLKADTVKSGLFRGLDESFQSKLEPGDIIVAGRNFGCGSSRETAIWSLKLNEIGAVVAADFARIFFRSATNNGLPCLSLVDRADLSQISSGDVVQLDFDSWRLSTKSGVQIAIQPVSDFVMKVWRHDGLLGLIDS